MSKQVEASVEKKFWQTFGNIAKKFILNKKVFWSIFLTIIIGLGVAIFLVIQNNKNADISKGLYVDAFFKFKALMAEKEITVDKAAEPIRALEGVIKTDIKTPEYYLSHANLGAIYEKLGKLEVALKNFLVLRDASLELDARGAALLNAGRIYQSLNKHEDALALYNGLLDEYPAGNFIKDAVYYAMGLCYLKLQKDDLALSAYKMVGKESSYRKDADDAIELIEKLKKLDTK